MAHRRWMTTIHRRQAKTWPQPNWGSTQIERKLGPNCHRLFGAPGQSSKAGLMAQMSKSLAEMNKSQEGV
jgi:hypothetical protein